MEKAHGQYTIQKNGLTFDVAYDVLSLMHYKAINGFAIDSRKPTMKSRVKHIFGHSKSKFFFIPSEKFVSNMDPAEWCHVCVYTVRAPL